MKKCKDCFYHQSEEYDNYSKGQYVEIGVAKWDCTLKLKNMDGKCKRWRHAPSKRIERKLS